MDFLKQRMRVLFYAILGCINSIPSVNSYVTHNAVFSPTPVPPYRNSIYVQPKVGPPMSALSQVLSTVTPQMPAAAPISSVYPRQFFNILPNRRTNISVRPVNIRNAIKTPQSSLYQIFTRLNPSSQAKVYNILRSHLGSPLPAFQTPPPSQSGATMEGNNMAAQSQPFTMKPQTKDIIISEVEQNAVLLQRLVGQNQIGSSTASRLERQVSDMKQKLAASQPAEGQQQEQLIKQLGNQFQKQITMFNQENVNTAVNSDQTPSSTGIVASNSLLDEPFSSPLETIDETFANVAADSGKNISFSSDIGPGTYKVEYDMLITQEDMEEKYNLGQDDFRVKRALVRNVNTQWTNGRIPYILRARDFSSTERRNIHLALREWESYTCVRFVPASPTDQYSIDIKNSDGCHSYVGMKRKNQMVGLAKPCRKRSIILHEIGHAIGMFHEQARPDRDNYINILYNHILPPVRFNFQRIDPDQTTNYSIAYDYLSIMHYGETAFSFNRTAITMKAKDPSFQKKMGKARRISFRDVMSVNKMYNCSGHCTVIPSCPFKEAFVGKDCRCWCPTDENDREPAKLCPTAPSVAPPRTDTIQTSNRRSRPNQSQREPNGVLLKIAFNPNGRQTSNGAANAVLTPVGRGHNFIRNPSDRGAPMLPTSGREGSESLAATLSNLPSSIRIGSLGERPARSRSRNSQSRNRAVGRRSNFRRLPSTRSQRPATTVSGNRLEQQLAKELSKLNGINSGTISRPSRPSSLLSGLMPTRQSGSDFNTLVGNAMSMLTGSRRGSINRNTNGAVVSSQTPGGGVATADLKQLLQELNRMNNQMSTQMPAVGNVRHTHVRPRSRNILRELSDFVSQSGQQQRPHLSDEQTAYLLQKLQSSTSVTHTHPVVIRPSSGHHHHHHHHHNHHNDHQHNGILSPITENTHFHTNP